MSASTRIPVIASTLTLAFSALALTTSSSLRTSLSQLLPTFISSNLTSSSTSSNLLTTARYTLITLSLLLNLKALPFVWHIRVLRGILYQIHFNPHPLTSKDLFRPIITESWNAIAECDYNLHKSNSTYFADLDVGRAHFVGALLRTGLKRLNKGDAEGLEERGHGPAVEAVKKELGIGKDAAVEVVQQEATGVQDAQDAAGDAANQKKKTSGAKSAQQGYFIALGGVACVFRKEIKPLERFEVWTRLLAWDRKWIYIVSHIVRKGAVKPEGWTMQPWKNGKKKSKAGTRNAQNGVVLEDNEDFKKHVFASSISKYVCKKGRMTVPPEVLLERSYLLPKRPMEHSTPDSEDSLVNGDASTILVNGEGLSSPENIGVAASSAAEAVSASLSGANSHVESADEGDSDGIMTWAQMEAERQHGLKIAEQFEGLTALHDEFGRDPYEDIDEEDSDVKSERQQSGKRKGMNVLGHFSDFW